MNSESAIILWSTRWSSVVREIFGFHTFMRKKGTVIAIIYKLYFEIEIIKLRDSIYTPVLDISDIHTFCLTSAWKGSFWSKSFANIFNYESTKTFHCAQVAVVSLSTREAISKWENVTQKIVIDNTFKSDTLISQSLLQFSPYNLTKRAKCWYVV